MNEPIDYYLKFDQEAERRRRGPVLRPTELGPASIEGFDLRALQLPPSSGLFVVTGKNNSGKTRFLQALEAGGLSFRGSPSQFNDTLRKHLRELDRVDAGLLQVPLLITWTRHNGKPGVTVDDPEWIRRFYNDPSLA